MIPHWLSFIDVGFVVAVLLFAWGGFQKGFASQVAHILTALAMGGLLFFAYPYVHNFLASVFRRIDEAYIMWAVMIALGVLTVFIFILFSKLVAKALKSQISDSSDHAYGLILGLFRGVLTALLFMIVIAILGPPRIEKNFQEKSYTGTFVARELVPRIRPHVGNEVWIENKEKIKMRLQEERDETTRARTQP